MKCGALGGGHAKVDAAGRAGRMVLTNEERTGTKNEGSIRSKIPAELMWTIPRLEKDG